MVAGGSFVAPNEWHPEHTIELVRDAPEGVYISVGTERGVIGATITQKVTHLVLGDYDPEVLRYNQINVALAGASHRKDREHFVSLRKALDHDVWLDAVKAKVNILPEHKEILSSADNFKFWRKHQTKLSPDLSHRVSYDFEVMEKPELFVGVNYLREDRLFEKFQSMAESRKIDSILLDFTNLDGIEKLVKDLTNLGLKISVLDISNAWLPQLYTLGGEHVLNQVVLAFQKIASPTTRLLTSGSYVVPYWLYSAFTFSFLDDFMAKQGDIGKLIGQTFASMQIQIAEKINLRVGRGGEPYADPGFGRDVKAHQSPLLDLPSSPKTCRAAARSE